jgi:hypothetical protein
MIMFLRVAIWLGDAQGVARKPRRTCIAGLAALN